MVNFLSPRQFAAVVLVAWMWISLGFCRSVVISSELFSMGKLISYGLPPVAVCFAQGDPSQGAGGIPSQVQKLEPVTFVLMREWIFIILENESYWLQVLFWWIYWVGLYLGWKQGLFSMLVCTADVQRQPVWVPARPAPLSLCQCPAQPPLLAGDSAASGEEQWATPLLPRCREAGFKNKPHNT